MSWYSRVRGEDLTPAGRLPCLIAISLSKEHGKGPLLSGGMGFPELEKVLSEVFDKNLVARNGKKGYLIVRGAVAVDENGKVIGDSVNGLPMSDSVGIVDENVGLENVKLDFYTSDVRKSVIKVGKKPGRNA
jgi:hypothetical protein